MADQFRRPARAPAPQPGAAHRVRAMTDHAIAARRDGDDIAIEIVEIGGEYGEVLTTQYLGAEAAIRFFEGGLRLARQIKSLPLATSYSLYPEDAEAHPAAREVGL